MFKYGIFILDNMEDKGWYSPKEITQMIGLCVRWAYTLGRFEGINDHPDLYDLCPESTHVAIEENVPKNIREQLPTELSDLLKQDK